MIKVISNSEISHGTIWGGNERYLLLHHRSMGVIEHTGKFDTRRIFGVHHPRPMYIVLLSSWLTAVKYPSSFVTSSHRKPFGFHHLFCPSS